MDEVVGTCGDTGEGEALLNCSHSTYAGLESWCFSFEAAGHMSDGLRRSGVPPGDHRFT